MKEKDPSYKDNYSSLLEARLPLMFPRLARCPPKDKEKMKRIVILWIEAGNILPLELCKALYKDHFEERQKPVIPISPPKLSRLKETISATSAPLASDEMIVEEPISAVGSVGLAGLAGLASIGTSSSIFESVGGFGNRPVSIGISSQSQSAFDFKSLLAPQNSQKSSKSFLPDRSQSTFDSALSGMANGSQNQYQDPRQQGDRFNRDGRDSRDQGMRDYRDQGNRDPRDQPRGDPRFQNNRDPREQSNRDPRERDPRFDPREQSRDPREQSRDLREQNRDPREQSRDQREQDRDPRDQNRDPRDRNQSRDPRSQPPTTFGQDPREAYNNPARLVAAQETGRKRVAGETKVLVLNQSLAPGPACESSRSDSSVPADSIKVESRTLFFSGIPEGASQNELKAMIDTVGRVESIRVNTVKNNAFIKIATRMEAERVKSEFHGYRLEQTELKVGWACGYGPKQNFDFNYGFTLYQIADIPDHDYSYIEGGGRGGGKVEGGMTMEEPNVPMDSSMQRGNVKGYRPLRN